MRTASILRETKETRVSVTLDLDNAAAPNIKTGIGFFDHMLTALFFYAKIGATVDVDGDLYVDAHHSVEDCGVVIGQALREACGDKAGIRRFADCHLPMDEALAFCALDISNRAYLAFDAEFPQAVIGGYDACLTAEFFRAVAVNAGLTLHLKASGDNSHHITEALFKAFGVCLRNALTIDGGGVSSTKGVL
ncbi:MAG: imidazoleglycerol-phosphate dehydratase HisB [Oscillospiraceae bacterium]|jgi:imidazoleglycerol-phosphate dehydratase|nr:imidazoleglycerol-phosphate dehydratase HisB [Oscillospiraceae bacterium]